MRREILSPLSLNIVELFFMKFSYNWLKELSGTKLSPEKLAEILTLRSFEIKEIKKDGQDFMMDIDVLPNRASDCFSHIGIAREIAAITGLKPKIKIQKIQLKTQNKKVSDLLSVEVKDREGCPRYTAIVLSDVTMGPSPAWLQQKLNVCGVQSINNVVDITNYVMLETGQPLHAFDMDKLAEKNGRKSLIVRRATTGEKMITLDDKKYDLTNDILVIADAKDALALAGIKGGKKAEIDSNTKNIVIESANFNRQNIYQTSKKINLRTDASLRFGSGFDPNMTEGSAVRAAELMQKIANGKVCKGIIDVFPKKVLSKKIILDLQYMATMLGVAVPQKQIINILTNLGFKIKLAAKNKISVEVSTRRMDVVLPEDLIEEIGRIYGYEKIPAVLPVASLAPAKRNEIIFWEDIMKDILRSSGFSEVYNYSFVGQKEAKTFGYKDSELLFLENPMSSGQACLRPSLLLNLIKNIASNTNNFKEIAIFEIGKVFQTPDVEQKMFSGVMTGNKFYDVKGIIDMLLNKTGVGDVWYDEYRNPEEKKETTWWTAGKCAQVKINQDIIGYIGEISPNILRDFKITGKAAYFDIFFDKLFRLVSEEREYRPISKYPSAIRDVAVLVPRTTRTQEILDVMERAGGELVQDIDVFDIYEGEELPDGMKNFAFRITYQSDERTLSSKEIDALQNEIIKQLQDNPEWQVRR
ncbi:MAG: phenylalanine--tRNA ligase subunit beta [Candidatus Nealsonbacteria bacterium]|nr:phenylalanine--tRNA ligase subunit beta [Candidatus Nealsonbacteria bacterium]